MPNITNAQVNTAAAAVSAPYGPLTRVTDVEALPQPNDRAFIALTDALDGNTIHARYEELLDAERVEELLAEANGYKYTCHAVLTELTAILAAVPLAVDGDYTVEEFNTVINRLREIHAVRNYL